LTVGGVSSSSIPLTLKLFVHGYSYSHGFLVRLIPYTRYNTSTIMVMIIIIIMCNFSVQYTHRRQRVHSRVILAQCSFVHVLTPNDTFDFICTAITRYWLCLPWQYNRLVVHTPTTHNTRTWNIWYYLKCTQAHKVCAPTHNIIQHSIQWLRVRVISIDDLRYFVYSFCSGHQ